MSQTIANQLLAPSPYHEMEGNQLEELKQEIRNNFPHETSRAEEGNEHLIGSEKLSYDQNPNLDFEIFQLFDTDGSGNIDINDLEQIGKAMGWKKQEVNELIFSLDPNHDGQITFEEFKEVLKNIEERLGVNQQQSQQQMSVLRRSFQAQQQVSYSKACRSKLSVLENQKNYQGLLPKTGVYFLPNEKIVGFLKVMNELRKKYEREENYTKAKLLKFKFDQLSYQEQSRQHVNMKNAQENELIMIEEAQKMQFSEFQDAWEKYMRDYEVAAFESVERLKEKHIKEITELHEKVQQDFRLKFKWSRELMEVRRAEKTYFQVKDYSKAEEYKRKADRREEQELEESQFMLTEMIAKNERLLRQRQQLALATLLKRIQRDREEQLKHKEEDTQRLMLRNNNLMKDIQIKQTTEQRKTSQFLKFALGKREIKTEEEIKNQIKNSAYNPSTDPLMGRIQRKFNPPNREMRLASQDSKMSRYQQANSKLTNQSKIDAQTALRKRNQSLVQQQDIVAASTARQNQGYSILQDINSFRSKNSPAMLVQDNFGSKPQGVSFPKI